MRACRDEGIDPSTMTNANLITYLKAVFCGVLSGRGEAPEGFQVTVHGVPLEDLGRAQLEHIANRLHQNCRRPNGVGPSHLSLVGSKR